MTDQTGLSEMAKETVEPSPSIFVPLSHPRLPRWAGAATAALGLVGAGVLVALMGWGVVALVFFALVIHADSPSPCGPAPWRTPVRPRTG